MAQVYNTSQRLGKTYYNGKDKEVQTEEKWTFGKGIEVDGAIKFADGTTQETAAGGGGQTYSHYIRLAVSNVSGVIFFTIVNDSNTLFNVDSLIDYFQTNLLYGNSNTGVSATGIIDGKQPQCIGSLLGGFEVAGYNYNIPKTWITSMIDVVV